jgi:hypothetical protein
MKASQDRTPTVSITSDALVIRIPWHAVDIEHAAVRFSRRRLTVEHVLDLVEAGRLAHRSGKTRFVRSLRDLTS